MVRYAIAGCSGLAEMVRLRHGLTIDLVDTNTCTNYVSHRQKEKERTFHSIEKVNKMISQAETFLLEKFEESLKQRETPLSMKKRLAKKNEIITRIEKAREAVKQAHYSQLDWIIGRFESSRVANPYWNFMRDLEDL